MTVLEAVDGVCRSVAGSGVGELLFRSTAVGDVFGVRMEDGSRVVVKVHQPREDSETLAAVLDVQGHHHRSGFPCPEPLGGPVAVGDRYATVEALVDDGEPGDTHEPARRRLVAEALASHLEIARACGFPASLQRGWNAYPSDRLWPAEAHDPRLDLAGTAAGAEWIDAFAARVKPTATRDTPPVLGHLDWSGKHFRFADDRITAVYDWDSVRVATEAVVVGNAAFAFTANWDLPGVDPAPQPDEVSAFIDEYDAARATRLTRDEREQLVACGVYLMAYVARCEHANGDPGGAYTRALRRHGSRYLRV